MSYFEGLPFFLALLPVLTGAVILGYLEKPLGRYTSAASVLFLVLVFWGSRRQMAFLLAFGLWSWLLVSLYFRVRKAKGRRAGWYRLFLAASLLPLAAAKLCPLAGLDFFGFTGISYLTFRVVQIIIETYDQVITGMSAEEFYSFLIFFPSVSSGPIDRSRRFLADRSRVLPREDYMELAARGAGLFLFGAVYKLVLASTAWHWMGYLGKEGPWYLTLAYAYAYGLYLFFDFAGYSRMAVGVSCMLGVETPDNFRAPFLAVDMRDFWNRWHITLSYWFRDYVFTRLVMIFTRKKWFKNRLGRACAGYFVNMGIMGLWHGVTPAYILYGLYHGALLAGTELFQKKSAWYRKNRQKTWYRILSWFVTMQMVMFGFLIFSGRLV